MIFPHVHRKLACDPLPDLAPITPVCSKAQAFAFGSDVREIMRNMTQVARKYLMRHPG